MIQAINEKNEGVVFILWGSYAAKKGSKIMKKKHCVLQGPHPSPLSAHRGFFGCKHFSQANEYLVQRNKDPIDWAALVCLCSTTVILTVPYSPKRTTTISAMRSSIHLSKSARS